MHPGTLSDAPTGAAGGDQELDIEEVAARLGLPVSMLVRRIEAGVLEASRVEGPNGVRYRVPAAALGLQVREEASSSGPPPGPAPAVELHEPVIAVTAREVPRGEEQPRYTIGSPEAAAVPRPADRELLTSPDLDARELVAALLDRWERTLEQRLQAEFRLHYESELDARQARISRLETELDAARGHVAIVSSEHDRLLGEMRSAGEAAGGEFEQRTAQLAEREGAVIDRLAELERRSMLVAEREAAVQRRERETERLQAELSAARRALSGRQRPGALPVEGQSDPARDREREELRELLSRHERAGNQLRAELTERDRALADLHAQLVRRDDEIDTLRRTATRRRGLFRRG